MVVSAPLCRVLGKVACIFGVTGSAWSVSQDQTLDFSRQEGEDLQLHCPFIVKSCLPVPSSAQNMAGIWMSFSASR